MDKENPLFKKRPTSERTARFCIQTIRNQEKIRFNIIKLYSYISFVFVLLAMAISSKVAVIMAIMLASTFYFGWRCFMLWRAYKLKNIEDETLKLEAHRVAWQYIWEKIK